MTRLMTMMFKVFVIVFILWIVLSWIEVVLFSLTDHDYQSWNLFQILIEHYHR